ncbi:alpha-mannosidase [Rubrivirga sp.]|uniref:alpha-mannosidase n=1 Tax=Rubrivirga sp. TaxID=1885344 RepID=UPI003B5243AC
MTDARIQRRLDELEHHVTPERWPVGGWSVSRTWPDDVARPTFADDLDRMNQKVADASTPDGFSAAPKDAQTYWLSTTATVPDALAGERVTLLMHTDAESMVYVDGEPWQALDENRGHIVLADAGEAGRAYRVDVMLFSSRDRLPKSLTAEFARVDPAVEAYRFDLRAILGVVRALSGTVEGDPTQGRTSQGDGGPVAARLRQALVASTNALDFHSAYGSVDVAEAARVLRDEVDALRERIPPTDVDVHLVGNSHIDVTWLWTLPETRAKMGRTTATALRTLDELPSYRFVQSQPQLYEFLRQDFPDLFARVQARVAEGRWEIIGASWLEPDCNITGGESLVRQILHGQRFWQEHFGRTSDVMWLPDTFGYAWALPQILAKSGIDTFVTQKLTWNNENTFPYGHFEWEGVDGTRVRCTFPQVYVARVTPETIATFYQRIPETETVEGLMFLYGYGDGGGGPVREDVEIGERLGDVPGFPRCTFSTARDALDKIRDEADGIAERTGRDVPVWKGELYLESHRGTLTTHARVKKGNRDGELRLREAEVWASLAAAQTDYAYPADALDAAWKNVLLNQFHDIVPGTSIEPVYDGVHARYAETLATADRALADALAALLGDGEQVAVVNSLGHPVTDWVEVGAPAGLAHVVDASGAVVPSQRTHDGRIGFEATVPALGSSTYTVHPGAVPPTTSPLPVGEKQGEGVADLVATDRSLDSGRFRLAFGDDGTITSLADTALDRQWLSGPGNVFQTFDDRPNQWEAWDVNDWYAEKPLGLFSLESSEVIEAGPVRAVLRQTHTTPAGSTIRQDVIVYRTVPRVDFDTHVDWRERRVLLKVAFPVAVHSAHAAYEIQFGTIERPTSRNTSWEQSRFEVAAHKWTDLSEGGGGLSLLNDSKYGHDIRDDVMRITLLRNPVFPDPRSPWQEYRLPGREDEVRHTDTGKHRIRYAVHPHAGDWRAGTVHQARAFNSPLRVVPGVAAATAGGAITTDGVKLEALKQADDGDGFIVRVYEAHGARGAATVRLPFEVASAEAVDLMERPCDETVALDDGALAFHVLPFEIRTVRVRPA